MKLQLCIDDVDGEPYISIEYDTILRDGLDDKVAKRFVAEAQKNGLAHITIPEGLEIRIANEEDL